MSTTSITDFIKIYDFESTDLLKFAEMADPYLEGAMTSSGDTDYRKCKNFWFDENIVANFGLPTFFKSFYAEIDRIYNEIINQYCKDFPNCNNSLSRIHTGFHLLRYDSGDYYKEHVDDFRQQAFRRLSLSLCINDDFEGGEFQFFNTYTLNLKKNQCCIFPSTWMFPHKILPITSGVRRSIVSWTI
jgi:hypothetical protein